MKSGGRIVYDALRDWVTGRQVPAGVGLSRALGAGLLLTLAVVVLTGLLLGLVYAPTPDHAV